MIDKTKPARTADIRGISDPPDMGKLKPADEVAKEMVRRGRFGQVTRIGFFDEAEEIVTEIIRQSRVEGAVAALEAAATKIDGLATEAKAQWRREQFGSEEGVEAAGATSAYEESAYLLRARIKDISDPPDMG
jgi:hypothetical protein